MGQQQPMPPQGYGGQGPPPGGYQQYPAPHHQPPQGQMPGPMPGQGPSQAQPPQPYPQQYPGPDPQGQWHGHDQHPQWQGQYPQGQYPGPAHGDQHAGPPHQGQWQRQQTYSQGPEYSQPPSTSSAPYQDPQQYAPPPSYPTPSSQPTSAVSAVPPSDFGAKPLAKPPTSSQERRESIPTSQRAASVDMARSQSRQSMNDSVSMESESEEEDENAPMDLSKLDIPDVPRGYPGIESRPPCLVGQPLPALLDSDQKDALQPPTAESKGHVQSRYINAGNLEYTLKNARNKYDFKENQDDPVFLPIREPTPPPVVEPRSERRGNGYYRGGDRPEPHLRRSRSPSNSRRLYARHAPECREKEPCLLTSLAAPTVTITLRLHHPHPSHPISRPTRLPNNRPFKGPTRSPKSPLALPLPFTSPKASGGPATSTPSSPTPRMCRRPWKSRTPSGAATTSTDRRHPHPAIRHGTSRRRRMVIRSLHRLLTDRVATAAPRARRPRPIRITVSAGTARTPTRTTGRPGARETTTRPSTSGTPPKWRTRTGKSVLLRVGNCASITYVSNSRSPAVVAGSPSHEQSERFRLPFFSFSDSRRVSKRAPVWDVLAGSPSLS